LCTAATYRTADTYLLPVGEMGEELHSTLALNIDVLFVTGCVLACRRYFMRFKLVICGVFFFFSSRRRHTRLVSDWSSDVCSSDLSAPSSAAASMPSSPPRFIFRTVWPPVTRKSASVEPTSPLAPLIATVSRGREARSEERRVGKEGRAGWSRSHEKKRKTRKERWA